MFDYTNDNLKNDLADIFKVNQDSLEINFLIKCFNNAGARDYEKIEFVKLLSNMKKDKLDKVFALICTKAFKSQFVFQKPANDNFSAKHKQNPHKES